MKIFYSIISGIFGGLFRRWFGGWFEGEYYKEKLPSWLYNLLINRGTQTISLILLFFCCFMINNSWMLTPFSSLLIGLGIPAFVIALIMAIIFQIQYYSRGHGPGFDISRGGKPDAATIERYKKVWYNKICEWLIPEQYWYGFLYDYLWMTLRYVYGTIFLIPFLWSFEIMWLGLISSSIYALCWTIFEKDKWLIEKMPQQMVSNATQLAEVILGYVVGFWLMFK